MNNPEYILVDEMATIVTATKTALSLSVLNYQFGYVEELKNNMQKLSQDATNAALKFPMVYLVQPFTVTRDDFRHFGKAALEIFIVNSSNQEYTATQRMTNNFKLVLYPIYRELINQIAKSRVFAETTTGRVKHKVTDLYYWGDQAKILNEVFDCQYITGLELTIKNNCP